MKAKSNNELLLDWRTSDGMICGIHRHPSCDRAGWVLMFSKSWADGSKVVWFSAMPTCRLTTWQTTQIGLTSWLDRQVYKSCTVRGKKKGSPDSKPFVYMAPRPGLEPGTCGLTVRRSTD